MAKSRQERTVTKKHLARVQRERQQLRLIFFASLAVIVVIAGLIAYGLLDQFVFQPRRAVAVVNGENISVGEFQTRVRYERRRLVQQYIAAYQNMQLLGSDPNTLSYFQQSLRQIQFQLDPTTMGQDVINKLVEDRLIRQEAARLGITVTEEEINQYIEEGMGYYPEGVPPTSTPYPTTVPTPTLNPTQMALVPPTATATATAELTEAAAGETTGTPAAEQTGTPQATEASSEATPAASPTVTPTAGPSPTPSITPSPTPYTLEEFQANFDEFVKELDNEIGFGEADLRKIIESDLYREKVMAELTKDVDRSQEQVWARHILVEDEELAKDIKARLDNGEDFAALAAEFSIDESNKDLGGDLQWFGLGRMVAEFETIAFNLPVAQISDPVQTQFGYHIIQVLGHTDMPLAETEYQELRQTKFNEWLSKQRLEQEVEIKDIWEKVVPDEPAIPAEILV